MGDWKLSVGTKLTCMEEWAKHSNLEDWIRQEDILWLCRITRSLQDALAKCDPLESTGSTLETLLVKCRVCDGKSIPFDTVRSTEGIWGAIPGGVEHTPECLWRQAVESELSKP
jgi:hypothetical protein